MNWNTEALSEANRRDRSDSDWYARGAEILFASGAKWQREQLRTDEAIERVANFLIEDNDGETLKQHMKTCLRPDRCEVLELWRRTARAAITALLGEES